MTSSKNRQAHAHLLNSTIGQAGHLRHSAIFPASRPGDFAQRFHSSVQLDTSFHLQGELDLKCLTNLPGHVSQLPFYPATIFDGDCNGPDPQHLHASYYSAPAIGGVLAQQHLTLSHCGFSDNISHCGNRQSVNTFRIIINYPVLLVFSLLLLMKYQRISAFTRLPCLCSL